MGLTNATIREPPAVGVQYRAIAPVVTLLAVAILITLPTLIWGPRHTHSATYNIIWTSQIGDAFRHGALYPRWLPRSFEGLGSPTFFFYPPLAFFVSGGLHAIGLSLGDAINWAGTAFLFASGVSMYAWLKWRGQWALLGSALYMVAPYHLLDLYTRGDLAEFAAFAWLPLLVLGVEALRARWGPPLLAVAVAGILMTHMPTALLAAAFLVGPLAAVRAWKDRSIVASGLAAAGVGCALAGIYLTPALTLQDHIQAALLWSPYYRPRHWFVWNWGPAEFSFLGTMVLAAIGWVLLAAKSRNIWLVLTLVSSLAAFGLLPIVALPPLSIVQFPWRLLAVVEFCAITALCTAPPRRLIAALGSALIIPALVAIVTTAEVAILAIPAPSIERLELLSPDAPEYLAPGIIAGGVTELHRTPDLAAYAALPRVSRISVSQPGRVVIARGAFPIWRVMHNGVPVPTSGPLLSFAAEPGEYSVERVWIWPEILGAAISVFGLLGLLAMIALPMRSDLRWAARSGTRRADRRPERGNR
jgi:uncharacterized membrane protein